MARARRSLAGRVVAITGGARGLGAATAAALIDRGARVAIGDLDAPLAQRTAQALGAETIGLPLDVTDSQSFEAFLQQVETKLGPLDVLINNAGILPIGPFATETEATARRMVEINVHGLIIGSKLALRRFVPRGEGHLVQIASSAGKFPFAGGATYCASKYAVVGLSEAIRQEYRGTGVQVSVVMPVVVKNTDFGAGLPQARGFKHVEPGDVADAIVEALQTGRFDVYVPKTLGVMARLSALLPRRATEAIARALKSDQVLARPDHTLRGAYEARLAETIALAEQARARALEAGAGNSEADVAAREAAAAALAAGSGEPEREVA
ncbi:MAG: SDR family NAD(P)-dependent oxidoreductase [Solirubrobacteraceae bacterium]